MSEYRISRIEKEHLKAPRLETGESVIVLQRHALFQTSSVAKDSGRLSYPGWNDSYHRGAYFFEELLEGDSEPEQTNILFVAGYADRTDGRYACSETCLSTRDAVMNIFGDHGVDATKQIINLNPDFQIRKHPEDLDVRPFSYLQNIQSGKEETLGRTRQSIRILGRYASWFHHENPDRKLVIWANTFDHLIGRLVIDALGQNPDEPIVVDHSTGIAIKLDKNGQASFKLKQRTYALDLGNNTAS